MRKKLEFLNYLKDLYHCSEAQTLIKRLANYYCINDLETGENHGKIFAALYLADALTFDEIANSFYVSVYTLYRYRQRYNRLAELLVSHTLLEEFHRSKSVR